MIDEQQYDIAIIGGGLAGLSLAIQCATKNHKTILFEKEEYPFHKVCGEYISMESRQFLQSLGFEPDRYNLPVINSLLLSDAKGREYTFPLSAGGIGISRYTMDNLLYQVALDKGVMVHTGRKVNDVLFDGKCFTIITDGSHYKASVAAGCYGKRSNLDVKWKRTFTIEKPSAISNFIGVKYHIRYKHSSEQIALHNFNNGYCGMSKIEADKSCLCYMTTAENLRRSGNSIEEMQRNIVCKNPRLREIFSSAEFLYPQPLVISQINFSKKKQVEDHVLMLGDAAGLISPLCGNGMSMALHSSKIAFQLIQEFLTNTISRHQMEVMYIAKWKEVFSKRLWVGRHVQRFFGGNYSTSAFLKLVSMFPGLAGKIIDATHGQPY